MFRLIVGPTHLLLFNVVVRTIHGDRVSWFGVSRFLRSRVSDPTDSGSAATTLIIDHMLVVYQLAIMQHETP